MPMLAGAATAVISPANPAAIILPASPTLVERTAARELAAYLEKMQLGKSVILGENDRLPAGRIPFYVGWSKKAEGLLGRTSGEMAHDEYEVNITDNGEVVLAGHPTRGTLYAVYEFLEKNCGVRWWTPTEETVPTPGKIALEVGRKAVIPAFSNRRFDGSQVVDAPFYNAKKRQNSHIISAEAGGSENDVILCVSHTMDRFVPDKAYFDSHRSYYGADESAPQPKAEYFALRNGRRFSAYEGQPCTTHPEVAAFAAANIEKLIRRKGGKYEAVWVAQNDNENYCLCDRCVAEEQRLGNRTDLFIDFVNRVAAILDKKYPGINVYTLAYRFTIEAPLTVIPAPNVRICLCFIEANGLKPITDPSNARFETLLRDWSAVSSNLRIWHYTTNFTNFGLIHPTTRAMAADYRLFRELGVRALYTQDASPAGLFGWFQTYRTCLSSAMMVDPDLDIEAFQQDFFRGYYGPAAGPMREMMNFFEDRAEATTAYVTCYHMDTSLWLDWKDIMHGDAILRKAESAVRPGTVYADRVARIRTALDWTRMWRHENTILAKVTGIELDSREREWVKNHREPLAATMAKIPKSGKWKNFYTREGFTLANHLVQLDGYLAPELPHINLPAELANVPEQDLIVIPPARYAVAIGQTGIKDYKSNGWMSVRLHLKGFAWAMRVDLPALGNVGEWEIFYEARFSDDTKAAQGVFANCGLYSFGTNFSVKTVVPMEASEFSNKYTLHKLGCADFKRPQQIYFGANGNASVPELLIGRIFLKRK
jgi:hypothetical protein